MKSRDFNFSGNLRQMPFILQFGQATQKELFKIKTTKSKPAQILFCYCFHLMLMFMIFCVLVFIFLLLIPLLLFLIPFVFLSCSYNWFHFVVIDLREAFTWMDQVSPASASRHHRTQTEGAQVLKIKKSEKSKDQEIRKIKRSRNLDRNLPKSYKRSDDLGQ